MVEAARSLATSGAAIMMVHLTKGLVFVVVALFYTSVVSTAPCQVSSAPTVSVDIRRDEVREVVDTSRDELERLATAAGKQDHRPVFSIYTAATGYKADIDSHVEKTGDDMFCAVPTAVRILVVLTDRVIHLAYEAQSNDCLKVVREHEWLHAHADEEALEKRALALVHHMRTAIAQTPLASANSAQAAKSQMAAAIGAQMDEQLSSMEQLRKQLDRSIDSPLLFARLHAACGDQGQNGL